MKNIAFLILASIKECFELYFPVFQFSTICNHSFGWFCIDTMQYYEIQENLMKRHFLNRSHRCLFVFNCAFLYFCAVLAAVAP